MKILKLKTLLFSFIIICLLVTIYQLKLFHTASKDEWSIHEKYLPFTSSDFEVVNAHHTFK